MWLAGCRGEQVGVWRVCVWGPNMGVWSGGEVLVVIGGEEVVN